MAVTSEVVNEAGQASVVALGIPLETRHWSTYVTSKVDVKWMSRLYHGTCPQTLSLVYNL